MAVAMALVTTFIAPTILGLGFDGAATFTRPDYHVIIVWLAALAGVLFARSDFRCWSVPAHWRAPLAVWAVLVAVTWPIVAARELDFSLVAARQVHPAHPVFAAPPRLASAFVVMFALTQLVGIVWLDFLWSQFAGRARDAARWVLVPLMVSAALGSVAGVYQRFGDIGWMNADIWSNMQRAGGLMLDANAFGTGVAFLAPACLALAWSMGRGRTLALIGYVVLGAGMWAAGSRTALIVFGIGSVALAIAAMRQRGWWQPRIGPLVALAAIAIFVIVAAVVPRDYTSANPLGRAFARVPRFEGPEIRRFATELWSRYGYGRAADQVVMAHPVSGVGVGAFYLIAPEYIYRDTGRVFPSDNAQNWWRQQIAELGVLGAVPALWVSVLVLQLCRPREATESNGSATVLRGTLIGLAFASLLGVPTQNPAILISFGAVLFWLGDMTAGSRPRRQPANVALHVMLPLALLVAANLGWSSIRDLRVPMRAMRLGLSYSYGLTQPQDVSAFGEVRWTGTHAVTVMPTKDRWLRLTVWAPYSDLTADPVELTLKVNGEQTRTRRIDNEGPVSFFIESPGSAAMLEFHASRQLIPGRALQIATTWHSAVRHEVPADQIIASPPEGR